MARTVVAMVIICPKTIFFLETGLAHLTVLCTHDILLYFIGATIHFTLISYTLCL